MHKQQVFKIQETAFSKSAETFAGLIYHQIIRYTSESALALKHMIVQNEGSNCSLLNWEPAEVLQI